MGSPRRRRGGERRGGQRAGDGRRDRGMSSKLWTLHGILLGTLSGAAMLAVPASRARGAMCPNASGNRPSAPIGANGARILRGHGSADCRLEDVLACVGRVRDGMPHDAGRRLAGVARSRRRGAAALRDEHRRRDHRARVPCRPGDGRADRLAPSAQPGRLAAVRSGPGVRAARADAGIRRSCAAR